MAAKKRRRPKQRPWVFDVSVFADLVAHQIKTAEVKTATPSRAQNKIQVRIAWTEREDKPGSWPSTGLGYVSMDSGSAERIGTKSNGPAFQNFLDDVFRLQQWARAAATNKHGTDADWGMFHDELMEELKDRGALDAASPVHELHKKAVSEIERCAKSGAHKQQRRSKNQEKAKDFLMRNILFALNNGLSDAEIHEIVNMAFVKHTMES